VLASLWVGGAGALRGIGVEAPPLLEFGALWVNGITMVRT
jgi:hypothetical protein